MSSKLARKCDAVICRAVVPEMQGTAANQLAGIYLRQCRRSLDQSGREFSVALSAELGLSVSPSSLTGYEKGRRAVPAAVMIAASRLSGMPMVVDERSEELFLERIERRLAERARGRG